MKLCRGCGKDKEYMEFNKDKSSKNGHVRLCRVCTANYKKEYYENNREKVNKTNNDRRSKNRDKINKQAKEYYEKNKEIIALKTKAYQEKNKELIKPQKLEYRKNNKEKIAEGNKLYYEKNVEAIAKQQKEKYEKNKNTLKFKEQRRRHRKNSAKKPVNKLRRAVRRRITDKLFNKNIKKKKSVIKYLGCSMDDLKLYLEQQFYDNPETGEKMTWENYGFNGWHIDHILPLASFDLTDEKQLERAANYTNLQPLWAKENWAKAAKII